MHVATDGSCLVNPGGAYAWAWVSEDARWAAAGYPPHPGNSNQVAELRGLYEALRALTGERVLTIEIDSQYTINCATTWRQGWELRGGLTSKRQPIKHYRKIQSIWALLDDRTERGFTTNIEWVRGHNNHPRNEFADARAGEAASDAMSSGESVHRGTQRPPVPSV